ncbi:helix-turn-helix domain-containing protein [Scopulibacillus cellulosilyticus]|uniref:Helix-turn-helix domain-containing protein n=1 Tax=Scopulibacillus cellulosilyticus TaxID=2665665 RepID=A0ABW2Q1T4_9BACL
MPNSIRKLYVFCPYISDLELICYNCPKVNKKKAEREAIMQVLNMCHGNKTKAAKLLKISRPLLYQKMNRLGINHNTLN